MNTTTLSSITTHPSEDRPYHQFLDSIRDQFSKLVTDSSAPLFLVNRSGRDIWEMYLSKIPAELRQHNTCHTCRHFFERFAGIVMVTESGNLVSPIWSEDNAPDELAEAVRFVRVTVEMDHVADTFHTEDLVLGTPSVGGFRHYAVHMPLSRVHRNRAKTAHQLAAEKREDFRMLNLGLNEFSTEQFVDAGKILKAEAVSRSEKFVDLAAWLLAAKNRMSNRTISHRNRQNLMWLDVGMAPAGWCHVKSGMIGTMLEDLAAGLAIDAVRARWNAKMHPLQYQRPQAAPKAGAIDAAEKLVDQMGLGPSLVRRYARLEDVELLWRPTPAVDKPTRGGVFAGVKARGEEAKASRNLRLPGKTMTWEKFARTVLPTCRDIELFTPVRGDYVGLTTAVHPDAPPILQWDREDRRNPVSWYRRVNGSLAGDWGLKGATWWKVTGVCDMPANWFGARSTYTGIVFLLNNAIDWCNNTSALFPETLRSELHGIRSVVEAYSNQNKLQGEDEASACGLALGSGGPVRLRVTDAAGDSLEYTLDRLD